MPRYRVTIQGRDYTAMADLVRQHRIDVARHTVQELPSGGYSVQAHVDKDQIPILEAAGYAVTRHENTEKAGKRRQAEIGSGNRYR
jgi:hypothetical protein